MNHSRHHNQAILSSDKIGQDRKKYLRSLRWSLAILTLAASPGCTLLGVRTQVQAIDHHEMVGVEVAQMPEGNNPVYAVVLDGKKLLGAEKIAPDGVGLFMVPVQRHTCDLVVFADRNRNHRFDQRESAGLVAGVRPVSMSDPNDPGRLQAVTLKQGAAESRVGLEIPNGSKMARAAVKVSIGEVAKLTDRRFADTVGVDGLWKPMTTLKMGDLGVYFIEPYDPTRIPVLFVHGIGGSPRDFDKMIPRLDRQRYQAWFYFYPSGFRLGKAGNALDIILDILLKKHNVSRMHLVAHSMGGLVSRSAILGLMKNYGREPVEKFVSLSTPWGGDDAASSGVRAMKYPLPAWIDMDPKSKFLRSIWATKLPTGTRFSMIYGFDTISRPWLSHDNDTIINEKSAADPRAQNAAESLFVAPYDHMGVLRADETINKVWEFLDEK